MNNRCTIVTRLSTADGLVSEVYNGDTDAEQALIVGHHPRRARAGDPRPERDRPRGRLAGDGAVDQRHPARPRPRAPGDRLRRHRDLGRVRQGARAAAPPGLGERHRQRCPISVIGGYYHLDRRRRCGRRMAGYVEAGFGGVKFKVGGRTPGRGRRSACAAAREALGPDFALMVDANQGYDRAAAVEFGRRVADLDIRWFEEPCRWTNDRRWMRDVRYQTGIPVVRRPERDDAARASATSSSTARSTSPTSTRRGRAARPIWRKAAGAGRGVRRPAGPPRGAAGLEPPARERARPHLRGVLRRGARPVLLAPVRHVDADPRRPLHLPERPGFGIELDWDYVAAHTVDRRVTDRRSVG